MDDSIDNSSQSFTFFLACFGLTRKPLSDKKKPVDNNEGGTERRRISFSKLRRRKNSSTKTVPVEFSTGSGKPQSNKPHSSSKSKSSKGKTEKLSSLSKRHSPAADNTNRAPAHQVPASKKSPSVQLSNKERPQETREGSEEKIIFENEEHLDQVDTCQKQFCRKIDAIRTGLSLPGSPDAKPKTSRTGSMVRSTSFPVPNLQKPEVKPGPNIAKLMIKNAQKKLADQKIMRKVDPVIGMSIIMVTLVIMLFWGRLCAILCTSAWFYFIPLLRTGLDQDENGSTMVEPDFDSEEYKKRVVLEGFLERSHRPTI